MGLEESLEVEEANLLAEVEEVSPLEVVGVRKDLAAEVEVTTCALRMFGWGEIHDF